MNWNGAHRALSLDAASTLYVLNNRDVVKTSRLVLFHIADCKRRKFVEPSACVKTKKRQPKSRFAAPCHRPHPLSKHWRPKQHLKFVRLPRLASWAGLFQSHVGERIGPRHFVGDHAVISCPNEDGLNAPKQLVHGSWRNTFRARMLARPLD